MVEFLNRLPPAAAMAGVYTMVDNNRGVWKAPANVSLNSVVSPAVNITHGDQEDLNVTPQGKSINAIRPFVGEGVLVWGARTLDGNSLDWRYVNVRRTMIMLEESIKLAAKSIVFEPNVANTWVTVKSMIRNFLTSIWKKGGLAGAVPDDAFSVFCGLGETMTPEDILEGIMRVTVLVAISRPAEFIEITFQQQMQKS
jgi:phage tail sheath protein FI